MRTATLFRGEPVAERPLDWATTPEILTAARAAAELGIYDLFVAHLLEGWVLLCDAALDTVQDPAQE